MEFSRNIILSVVMHATLITAIAGFVAGRDAEYRVPQRLIAVALFEGLSEDILQPTSLKKNNTKKNNLQKISKNGKVSSPEIYTAASGQKSSLPPQVEEKKGTFANLERQTGAGFDNVWRLLPSQVTNKGNASLVGLEASISEQTGAGESSPHGTNKAMEGNSDAAGAIRTAIERSLIYPFFAKKRGIEGTVITEFSINGRGYAENIKIILSSGSDMLDSAAMNIVTRAAPFPHINGTIEIPITFRLKKDK